jgi:hypothetical protein
MVFMMEAASTSETSVNFSGAATRKVAIYVRFYQMVVCLACGLLHGAELILEKLIVARLIKKFHALYGTRRSITFIARGRHLFVLVG